MSPTLKSPAAISRNAQPSKTAKAGAANIMSAQAKSQRRASPRAVGTLISLFPQRRLDSLCRTALTEPAEGSQWQRAHSYRERPDRSQPVVAQLFEPGQLRVPEDFACKSFFDKILQASIAVRNSQATWIQYFARNKRGRDL